MSESTLRQIAAEWGWDKAPIGHIETLARVAFRYHILRLIEEDREALRGRRTHSGVLSPAGGPTNGVAVP